MGVAAHAGGHMVKAERKASPPRAVVTRGWGVSTDPGTAKELIALIKGEAATKDIDSADPSTHHRVVGLPIRRGITAVRHSRVDGIALLQAEETSAGLHGGVEIRRRERKAGQAERIRGICLLGRDDAAAWPLIAAVAAGEGYGAHDTVAIDDSGPHV